MLAASGQSRLVERYDTLLQEHGLMAAQALLTGECDMALAGGVTIEQPHGRGYLWREGEILSPDGACRANGFEPLISTVEKPWPARPADGVLSGE